MLPDDLREAVSFQASHSAGEFRTFQKAQRSSLHSLAEELNAEWGAIGAGLSEKELRIRAKIYTPLFPTLLDRHELGEPADAGLPNERKFGRAGFIPDSERDSLYS